VPFGGRGRKRRTWRDEIPPEMIELLRPWAHPYLIFDTETLTDARSGQQAKIIFWQECGLKYADRCNLFAEDALTVEAMDECQRQGVAYNPLTCTEEEIKTVKAYAKEHDPWCCDMNWFIRLVFYKQAMLNGYMPEPKMIIGHNLPFDLGAISNRTVKSLDKKFYGALSIGMCRCFDRPENERRCGGIDIREEFRACGWHPNIRIKKLGLGKHMMKRGRKFDGFNKKGEAQYVDACLEFLDTRTLARALLGPGDASLEHLRKMLGTKTQKRDAPSHGEKITEEYLDYARDDVQCTWELFVKLRDLYKRHGLKKRITHIFSEASVGKGYFEELNIQSFFGYNDKLKLNTRNLDFDLCDVGAAMEGYFGGRSEARIRHQIIECMLADFRSQYTSVNALMKLQELLLAICVNVVRNSNSAREFLETTGLNELQKKDTWPKLRGFARIRPSGDGLPFRCEYTNDDGEKSINVGINYVKSACDGWYSFAGIIASKSLTGKCPEILETIEFVPVGRQTTKFIKICGDPKYTVDLSKDDLFVKVIELRTTVKADRDTYPKGSPDYDRLDAMQLALKLIANATSYGVLVEVIVDEHKAEVPCWVYQGKKTLRKAQRKTINAEGEWDEGFKVERPGKYFAPFGGLIPAAGRLLLAITETLARRAGLLYGFCDTDSMCIGRPPMMSRNDFRAAVQKIVGPEGWFQPLSPYSDGEPLFALEDVNYRLRDDTSGKTTKEFEPLFCLAISAKRYVLFNIADPSRKYPRGKTILRKIAGHAGWAAFASSRIMIPPLTRSQRPSTSPHR
jgi:hypothetical protein